MNHRIGSIVFGLVVGVIAAVLAYRWVTQPIPEFERAYEEQAVMAAREHLTDTVGEAPLEIIDVLNKDRVVGKGYVYRGEQGWEVSGFYRRSEQDAWHPYLMQLDDQYALTYLKISDGALIDTYAEAEHIEVLP